MRDFLRFCRHLFQLLSFVWAIFGVLALILFACAISIAFVEDMPMGEAVYFTLITGLTVGFGDITPATGIGQALSVIAGFIGVVVIGLVVAVATRALAQAADEKRHLSETDQPEGSA